MVFRTAGVDNGGHRQLQGPSHLPPTHALCPQLARLVAPEYALWASQPRSLGPGGPDASAHSAARWATGKTFLTTCFAGEIGVPVVMLKNFRSMWQGVTEGNLERVLNLLQAMCPIAVMVDEADAQLGNRSMSGDSGVSNRVFAQIAQFMGNTELRGKVIWFLLTSRPDLLPVDLKRQGRAEEHIALFYPETSDERLAMLRAMQKKTGTKPASADTEKYFLEHSGQLSGADIEAVLIRARMKSVLENDAVMDVEDLKSALDDFIPPSYPTEIEMQNLVAVLECTSRSLLPAKYREMDRAEIARRAKELAMLSRE